jgi:hypothetical protein
LEQKKYDINDYDLESDIGVYLSQMAFFHGDNCLIGTMKKVAGYIDASGKEETFNDKILVVANSLGTPFYWQEFSKEWIAFLIEKEYPIKPGKSQPTFHATDFHHGNYPFRAQFGWDPDRKKDLYDGLIKLIKNRTEYSVATGVDLEDYRRFMKKYPAAIHAWSSAGAFAFAFGQRKCRDWAASHKYNDTIPYIYDRNDKFADEMKAEYDEMCKNPERAKWWYFEPGGMHDGDKETYIPIQAVDVVAWEVARHYKEAHFASDNLTEFQTRSAIIELAYISAEYTIYGYEDFISFWEERKNSWVEQMKESVLAKGIIKTDAEFDEEYARMIVGMTAEEIKNLK